MTTQNTNPKVDAYLSKIKTWKDESVKLREIILDCDLTEDYKWMHPCYTLNGKNVVLIHGFKEYCAIMFLKGSLLKDPHGILIQQTNNVQGGRQIRFTNLEQIIEQEEILKAYIREAIEVEQAGLKVEKKEVEQFAVPEELQQQFDTNPAFQTAFEALTPGRQRAYLYHFSQPKQSKTKTSRIEKCMQPIMEGKGLND
ncbi:YdeI/OmpD-associated family protein [Paenibacillus silvae]|uniref:YdeI/OmpD-associated family protein n=1 Tax=Paenibacillus silvae TaxID=1325358 RepID=UPI0011A080DC|nr:MULTISPECIES: YdeI family protein [Paenibacillus]MCK6075097.1 YdeI family protein [Paenibacillus silvae]MCK6149484.1 YdeI family protein [Paenibacillus silvae]MCK6267783.1 YdeI family protein [Paenibacillus silvae]